MLAERRLALRKSHGGIRDIGLVLAEGEKAA